VVRVDRPLDFELTVEILTSLEVALELLTNGAPGDEEEGEGVVVAFFHAYIIPHSEPMSTR
jgi:hypothetical protein